MKHIAVIPARMGSQGLPLKNRMFFDRTADFIEGIDWFDSILVSTDDPVLLGKATARGYRVRERPECFSGSDVSIRAVFDDLVEAVEFTSQDVLWLFYIPLLYRNKPDYEEARTRIEGEHVKSVCTFIAAETHPYNCWRYKETSKELSQYIPNDNFRRQDLPSAWMHYHYVCCFKVDELPSLNSELLNTRTIPFFLDAKTTENLVEVDTPEDLDRWKMRQRELK
jgi:N-acylneuraminate cytidylyltransferase